MTTKPTSIQPQAEGRHQRSLTNYLVDKRFQLKYTAFLVAVTLSLSVVLGVFLWGTSRQLVAESKKVTDVVKMSAKNDPDYADNPELTKAITDSGVESDKLVIRQQRAMMVGVVGGLGVLVVLMAILGIYVTHKVAGPVYKMKLLLRQVGSGKLNFWTGTLRKGDELQDFFEEFQDMVEKLKARQAEEVAALERALAGVRRGQAPCASCGSLPDSGDRSSIAGIEELRDAMKAALDV